MLGLYYLIAFALSMNPAYTQKAIWLGAGLVGLAALPLFWRHIRLRHIPQEGFLLALFTLWASAGIFFVSDLEMFMRFLQRMMELTATVIFTSLILKNSGAAKWLYLAFLGLAVLSIFYSSEPVSMERIARTKVPLARIEAANAVGFQCFMGILGMLGLLAETKRLWIRLFLLGGGVLALYGVVLSGSRGAFAALIATAILWPLLCLLGGYRFKLKALICAVVMLLLAYWGFQFIIQATSMGDRFTKATRMEDSSTKTRFDLVLTGFRIMTENPILGCGLGQFGIASGTGYYAHNEVAEIVATTGLPGFFLYYSVYVIAWRRLSRSLKSINSSLFRYRINMARLSLLILLISGALSRPNFIGQDTFFLIGIVVGIAHWAESVARLARRSAGAILAPKPCQILLGGCRRSALASGTQAKIQL